MKNAKVLDQKDVRKILAEYFKVPLECVVNTKYSYVIMDSEDKDDDIHD